MKLLWFTWKDLKNPLAGGAEVVNEELAKRLVADGHEVTLVVGGFRGGLDEEHVNGYRIIRVGSRFTVYWHAWRYYRQSLQGWADLVIDEVNTIPFFAKFYVREPNITFFHMLCRQIWFYEMILPFSLVGYLLEPFYLWLLRDRRVITVSDSTKRDLMRFGFKPENITIISEGIELEPVPDLDNIKKYPEPTLLSLGAMRAMKRTLHQVKAFELAKTDLPGLKLKIAGDATGAYGQKVLKYIGASPYAADIEVLGRVSREQKIELMQRCHAILVTSVKEGWGLIVTEAGSQGTPAVVYNVDGLRDSVRDGKTGLVARTNTPVGLSQAINQLLRDPSAYDTLRQQSVPWNASFTFAQSYRDFIKIIN